MLYYVECGVQFTNDYGDIGGAFYDSIGAMFDDVCKYINKESIESLFKDRCETIVNNTKHIGWNFHDSLKASYCEHFGK